MKKKENIIFIDLTSIVNNTELKNDINDLSSRSNPSSKEKKQSSNFIFNKKKLSKNIPKSNSKCYTKNEINNNKQKSQKRQSKINLIFKKISSDSKRQSSSIIKRNNNNPLRLSTPGKTTPNKNINVIINKNKIKIPYKKTINSQRTKENNSKLKTKKISIFKAQKNINKSNNKVIPTIKNKKEQTLYIKKIDKNNKLLLINKSKNNLINISSDNLKKTIKSCKQNISNINNINQVMSNAKQNIYINSNEIKIKNIYHPRSPEIRENKYIKNISPIKKINFINNKQKDMNITLPSKYRVLNSDNKYPNNHGYHEIIHKNSPKPEKTKIINENDLYNNFKDSISNLSLRNNRLFLDELITPNNNNEINNVSNTILITDFDNNKNVISYYSTLNSNKNLSPRNILQEENYNISDNNIYINSRNKFSPKPKNNLYLSPNFQKLDTSGQYNDIDTDNEDQQIIHDFGEQMLKRNKNYNFSKINESYIIPLNDTQNKELKINNSFNDMNKRKKIIDSKKLAVRSIPISYSCSKIKWRKYEKRKGYNNGNLNNNKRLAHNIISRKKKKKLVMEKSLNEQFLSQNNKIKNVDSIKEKISCCESIIDNDSINEIIKEFEKEIEDEEKREKLGKSTIQKKNINNVENIDNVMLSFLSENDNNISNMSKGSTNDSKIRKRKVRYYKTKNIVMEKNYDFFISPTIKKD